MPAFNRQEKTALEWPASRAVCETQLELIMNHQSDFSNIGTRIPVRIMGVSIAGDISQLSHDFIDCIAAIEPCGDDVQELWFHTSEGVSIRVLSNNDDLLRLGHALVSLFGGK